MWIRRISNRILIVWKIASCADHESFPKIKSTISRIRSSCSVSCRQHLSFLWDFLFSLCQGEATRGGKLMVSSIRAVPMSLLPGLTSLSSHPPPPFPAGPAQASCIPSSAVLRHHCWKAWPRSTTQGQKPGGTCIWYLHVPAVINVMQFCEFWWGCRLRKNKKKKQIWWDVFTWKRVWSRSEFTDKIVILYVSFLLFSSRKSKHTVHLHSALQISESWHNHHGRWRQFK